MAGPHRVGSVVESNKQETHFLGKNPQRCRFVRHGLPLAGRGQAGPWSGTRLGAGRVQLQYDHGQGHCRDVLSQGPLRCSPEEAAASSAVRVRGLVGLGHARRPSARRPNELAPPDYHGQDEPCDNPKSIAAPLPLALQPTHSSPPLTLRALDSQQDERNISGPTLSKTRYGMRQSARFFGSFLAHPLRVGAVVPTSRRTVRLMLEMANLAEAFRVAEFGAGTGAYTREILARVGPDAHVVAFEIDPALAADLSARLEDPRLHLVRDSAERAQEYLAGEKMDVVVSSLPFASMAKQVRRSILDQASRILRDDGVFLVIQ